MKLQTKKPRIARHKPTVTFAPAEKNRLTGRRLQDRRLKVWTKDGHCAMCGRFTLFPNGFELDHRIPLHQGGEDVEENCQILCNGPDGCHDKKTRMDGGYKPRRY